MSMNGLIPMLPTLTGAQKVGQVEGPIMRVHTDTRSLQAGDLFVALKGENFDGNEFLSTAREAGAVGAVAQRNLAASGLPGVEVPDTDRALGELARQWRQQYAIPMIAVTGSNGKTTVTQMVASILRAQAGDAALSTRGNLNNHIGVPLTLLRMGPSHRLAVVELGMNHPGEIAYLASLTAPTVALVNNAQREHLEFMQSVEAVAKENGSVIAALAADGVAVFPSDDVYTTLWRELAAQRRVMTFSDTDSSADVRAASVSWAAGAWQVVMDTPEGQLGTQLHIAGRHNVRNALAAAACALAAGVSREAIASGLSSFEPVGGRSRAMSLRLNGAELNLVDDTYNANPDSVLAAVRVLAELPGPRLLVLGDMGEVGNQGLAFHREVLEAALQTSIEQIWCTGQWFGQAATFFANESRVRYLPAVLDLAQTAASVLSGADAPASMLVKGSRFMRMERVVQAVVDGAQGAGNAPEEGAVHHAA